jgi:outer membrane protein
MKKWTLCAIVLSVLALPMAASAGGFEFAVGGWYVNPDGKVAFNNSSGANQYVDFDRAGIDDEWQIMFRSKIQPPLLPGIYLQATPMTWGKNNGGDLSNINFSFGDTVFFPGDRVESEFYLNEYDAALYIPIPLLKRGTLGVINIELGAGARWIHAKTGLTNTTAEDEDRIIETGTLEDSQKADIVYPVGYAALIIRPISRLSLEGEAWGWSNNGNSFWTLNGRLKLILLGPLYLDGGYREDYYDIDTNDLNIRKSHFKGPYGEIGLQF